MLAHSIVDMAQQPFAQVASETGLHPDILRMLVRDGLLEGDMVSWSSQGGVCDIEQAREIAARLDAARAPVEGQGITATDAAEKYGFNRRSIYYWYKNGWVNVIGTGSYNAQLFNEGDIAFARVLADIRGQIAGKSIFPAKPRSGRPRKQ
ncbi:hypothetical protein GF412_05810 [Candidatus Micrarchaeota archaeon]|nr:hypothetical protein [Candidatus Micrarchaeota archaeon]